MTGGLQLRALSKRFSGVHALEDVDAEVQRGEILGLVGPNGSGKTTLFNCVTGFVRASGGRISWKGHDITDLAPDQIARLGVVRTFQQKMVFPNATVRRNVEMAQHNHGGDFIFRTCDQVLEFLGLLPLAGRLASDIPFGSARSLGVGLALAASPELLLLDEPAAGLTYEETTHLAELIRRIRDLGVTVWVIEHDMQLVMSICERIIVLHAGRKIAEGRPAEVANNKDVVTVYLGEKFARDHAAQ